MSRHKTPWTAPSGAVRPSAMAALLALILTSGCAETMTSGDAGCLAYGEARINMPRDVPLDTGPWAGWIADTDDRMTGACQP